MPNKVYPSSRAALEGVLFDGMTIMSGGFGLSGNPESLIPAIRDAGTKELTVISNNCGADGFGLWMLLAKGQIRKMISSYIGDNKLFEQLYLSGKLELELNPHTGRSRNESVQAAPAFPHSTRERASGQLSPRESRSKNSMESFMCARHGSRRTLRSSRRGAPIRVGMAGANRRCTHERNGAYFRSVARPLVHSSLSHECSGSGRANPRHAPRVRSRGLRWLLHSHP